MLKCVKYFTACLPMKRENTLPVVSSRRGKGRAVIRLRPSWAHTVVHYTMREGDSLEEGLRRALRSCELPAGATLRRVLVWVDNRRRRHVEFAHIIPHEDTFINVLIPVRGGGGGGKNPLRTIMSVAVIALAAAATWYVGGQGAWLGVSALGLGGVAGAIAGAGVMMLGTMAVNMLAPLPQQKALSHRGGANFEQTQAITGARNAINPYGIVQWVLGTIRYAPNFAAPPYSEIIDGEVYHYYLFIAGKGRVRVRNGRVGDTPVKNFTDYEEIVHEGWEGGTGLTFFKNSIVETAVGAELLFKKPVTRSCPPGATRIGFQILMHKGLFWVSKKGDVSRTVARYYVEYRIKGGEWKAWSTPKADTDEGYRAVYTTKISGGPYQKPIRRAYYKNVPAGDYEIRIKNVWDNSKPTQRFNDGTFELVRGSYNDPPIAKGEPITVIEVRVKQGTEFQGSLDEFNWEFTSYAPVPSGNSWVDKPTNNPASLALLVARHGTDKPQPWSAIDQDQWRAFYQDCQERGFEFNTLVNNEVTAGEITRDILSGGRASYFYRPPFGHSVLADRSDKPLDFDFSPLNSWGFSAEKSFYVDPTQAMRVLFLNKHKEYLQDERIVYADGYNANNTTRIDELTMTGQTDPDKVYREVRFHMAQSELRPETYSFHTDFAGLTVSRGSRIRFAHDALMVGLSQGRVVGLLVDYEGDTPLEDLPENEVAALPLLGVELDCYCPMQEGKLYGARSFDGINEQYYSLITEPNTEGIKREVRFAKATTVGKGPKQGDMVYFGEAGRESMDGLVLDIEREEDLVHKITFCDFAPDVHVEGPIPPFESNITAGSPWGVGKPEKPIITQITSGSEAYLVFGGAIDPGMLVTYRVSASLPDTALYVEFQYKLQGESDWQAGPRGGLTETVVRIGNVQSGQWYDVRARVVGIGKNSDWAIASHRVEGLLLPLPDVQGFMTAFSGSELILTWLPVEASRPVEYEIRRGYAWTTGIVVGVTGSTQMPVAGDGTYFIKARSLPAYSSNATKLAVTDFGSFQKNIIAVLDEARDEWPGPMEGFSKFGNTLIFSPAFVSQNNVYGMESVYGIGDVYEAVDIRGIGYYASDSSIYNDTDVYGLGDVYRAELVGRRATYTLLEQDRITLSAVTVCSVTAEYSAYAVNVDNVYRIQDIYTSNDVYSRVDGFTSITIEMRIHNGTAWSEWMPFTTGDYAGLYFDFRLVAEPPENNATVIVTSFLVTVDVPDRLLPFSLANLPATATELAFYPPFNGGNGPLSTPVLTSTVLNAGNSEYVKYFDITRSGCKVQVMRGDKAVSGFTANIYAQGW